MAQDSSHSGGERTLVEEHDYRGSTITVYHVTDEFYTSEVVEYTRPDPERPYKLGEPIYTGRFETSLSRAAHHESCVNGKTYYGFWGPDTPAGIKKATKSAHHSVDVRLADERDLKLCQKVCGYAEGALNTERLVNASTPLNTKVAFYSRGKGRIGIVSKVGRTNVEVAYVTPSNPNRITRKTHPFTSVEVL